MDAQRKKSATNTESNERENDREIYQSYWSTHAYVNL